MITDPFFDLLFDFINKLLYNMNIYSYVLINIY